MSYPKTKKGRALTPRVLEELAREAEAGYDLTKAKRERVGRPSLGAGSGTSPRIAFRATPEIYRAASGQAQREGRSLSDLARDALAAYLVNGGKARRARRPG